MGVDDEEGVGLVRGGSPPFPSTFLSEIRLKQDEYWGGHGKNGIGG
jgi:hypothetical protein